MRQGDPIVLEVLGPHGWLFRLDPTGVANIWPCGPAWSWIRMTRSGKDPLLVRGNAVTLIAQCDELCAQRKAHPERHRTVVANVDLRTSTPDEEEAESAVEIDDGMVDMAARAAAPTPTSGTRATWEERLANHERVIGPAHLHRSGDWIEGFWLCNDYARHSEYHGAYMRHLLKRYAALFFDHGRILHLCSGSLAADNPWLPGDTADINPAIVLSDGSVVRATYCTNAETCAGVPLQLYDTVFVDVPYGDVDAAKYGYPMLNRARVLETLANGLQPGALIVWLDEVTPPRRRAWPLTWEAVWGLSTSGGHRTRTVFVYRRTETKPPSKET